MCFQTVGLVGNKDQVPSHSDVFAGRKRKLRFDDHTAEGWCDRNSKRRAFESSPLSVNLTEEEKESRWITAGEKECIRQNANAEAQECRIQDNRLRLGGQVQFASSTIYSSVYNIVQNANLKDSDDVFSVLNPELLTFLAFSETRGLEDRTVPHLALERRLIRNDAIRQVLQAQQACKGDTDLIGKVAAFCSRPARKFAEALGVADATAAMMEYHSNNRILTKPVKEKSCNTEADCTSFGRVPKEMHTLLEVNQSG
ncbi:predicted protein [Phaeodactylum tricornutum CCAP 1055/1]|jgi:hypothetical protein|uniref:Uncharacterized protein n=1 Tax=Phaeodactylum tricornutum (strain CCAP 1055/1) TaxID=556484 RepID=B7FTK4_PHATC|nr:predicted protein [Phaeodactylum tricornutum CCAP 1055/1]EEC49831.1 predicted protein [Phaeodactylum tricornutum CCAP 1055/1]|eukprot:XP_002178166.1 predicted protein [Phaeodactylum tricornutum CCAP 1055/1]